MSQGVDFLSDILHHTRNMYAVKKSNMYFIYEVIKVGSE